LPLNHHYITEWYKAQSEWAAAAKSAAVTAARESAALTLLVRQLEWQKGAADAQVAYADRALASAKTDQAKAEAEDIKGKAAAKAADLAAKLNAAKADAKKKLDAAKAAQAAAGAAKDKMADTAKAAREAKLALEPFSIFISRATQKLYVRRDTHTRVPDGGEMFDTPLAVPVTIRNPGAPIGTHVFTAVARTDGGLRWTAVTIDSADDAKDALHRVTIPQDVLDRIAPTALPLSSIVISDEPLNGETNYRTEFVVVLNNQPQGGLAMRERPEDDRVADRNTSSGAPSAPGNFFGFGRLGSWDSSTPQNTGQNYYSRKW
jgi:hypothetical protein